MMKRKLFLLFYSFLLVSVWATCFMMQGSTNSYTMVIGMSFTFLSVYFLQKEYDFQLLWVEKLLILIFPIIYIIPVYVVLYSNNSLPKLSWSIPSLYQNIFYIHLVNPVLVGIIFLCLGMTKMKDLRKPVNVFIFTYMTIFYTYFLSPAWVGYWLGTRQSNFDTEVLDSSEKSDKNDSPLDYEVNLMNFFFIKNDLDTIRLLNSSSNKYILIETWSENCFPCIKAMAEMPDFYETIKQDVEVYYLYEHHKAEVRNKFDEIFSFKSIDDKNKILIDINQDLFNALRMNAYPYFLLFDSTGRLVYHFRGYPGRDILSTQILKHLK